MTAALAAGNAVVAKPAEQTPLVASPPCGSCTRPTFPPRRSTSSPATGAWALRLVAHRDVAGVVFTGSTEVARLINRTLAGKDGPIVPLIAETGGINAMIVDATASPSRWPTTS